MTTVILVMIVICIVYLFSYAYNYNVELQNNKLIKNLEEYEEKKAKQQESKV